MASDSFESPIVALNRVVALAMRDGPDAGLQAIDKLKEHKELQSDPE
jgi:RNA polymerase sigma-70 factor (ECF subfamily)